MKVDNQIQVLPLSSNDDRIRRAAYRAICGGTPPGPRYALQAVSPIHIMVANGHVTLVRVVAAQADKDLAGVRANTVNGVFP
jgi:hyperosmotically inducible protein